MNVTLVFIHPCTSQQNPTAKQFDQVDVHGLFSVLVYISSNTLTLHLLLFKHNESDGQFEHKGPIHAAWKEKSSVKTVLFSDNLTFLRNLHCTRYSLLTLRVTALLNLTVQTSGTSSLARDG